MADNKLLLKRGSDEDFLADDDPLAELARIVGFDAAPSPKPAPAARREPVFDLEDELLKELEIYSRPAEPDVAAAPQPVTQPAPDLASAPSLATVDERELSAPAVTYTDPEPEAFVRPPVVLEAVETLAAPDGGRVYDRPASHPVFDLEDEILREFAAFDARSVTSQTERVVEAEVVHQIEPSLADLPAELHDVPELGARPQPQGRELYDSFFDDDLHAAIGDAVAQSLGEPMQTVVEPILDTVSDQEAPFERIEEAAPADFGNWSEPVEVAETALDHAAADRGRDRDDAPSGDHTLAAAPVADTEAGVVEPVLQPSLEPWEVRAEVAPVLATDQELPAVADAQADSSAAPTSFSAYPPVNDYGLDDLLAEVERFPVGDASGRWGVQSKPAAPADLDRVSAPVARDFAPIPSFPEPDFTEAVTARTMGDDRGAPAMSAGDPLPDIDLEAVEAELLEVEDEEFSLSPDLLSAISGDFAADKVPPVEAEVDRVAPVQAEVAPSSFAAVERPAENADYSTLPFDPSQVVQEEDVVEAIAEMDVPDVQTVQEEERPAPHPEYDIDLDAEMAQLFVTASAPAASSVRGVQTSDAVAGPAGSQKAPPANLDLDEFERALEEDFRRSFSENRATSNPDRVPLAPVAAVSASNPRRRAFLLAGVAAVIAVVGGAGVFAFMSGDAPMITPSDPKVILADTDPVKVVPENPGGKEVPNQNKAVYDRVAGAKVDETKQESLVTSNEEPIDVVQRTLEPENLPMDDDAMAMATPTDDTADPRLLPDDAEQERVTTTSKVLSGVSPRKVKTMVVRPDGTLVEREVTEEDVKQQASNDAELMKIAQKAAQDAATATDSQADDIAKAIEDVPERLAPSDEKTVTPAESRQSTVEDVATEAEPVTEPVADPVDTVKPESEQPVAAEDVADEPAVAAAETDLEPSEATVAADKPTDRSLPADDQQAAADTEAAAKLAEAQVPAADPEVEDAPVRKVKTVKITPVPEVRPVDQPVNVVGTVNDQGAVQDAVEEKPQQVALADQNAEAPAAATPLPAGSYVIQIASLPSEAEAEASYSKLSTKFGGIIGGKGVDIRKAEIKNKGTYYRVRIPAGSKQEAQNLCAQYKKAGGSCLVSK